MCIANLCVERYKWCSKLYLACLQRPVHIPPAQQSALLPVQIQRQVGIGKFVTGACSAEQERVPARRQAGCIPALCPDITGQVCLQLQVRDTSPVNAHHGSG